MKNLRTIFMGTGPFAAPSLAALVSAGYDVVAVYTKPLTATGRTRKKVPDNPVRALAKEHNIPIHDPAVKLSDADVFAKLAALAPDIIIVAAYGKILPQSVLDLPAHGCVNVHASLLPRWRGASPIHNAIRAGDTQTGITIMRMDAGLDTGPVIAQSHRDITPDVHTPALFAALADDGAALLISALPDYISGACAPVAQSTDSVTTCRTLTRDDGRIDWTRRTSDIYNQFRAYDPWPGVFTLWYRDGHRDEQKHLRIKLTDIKIIPNDAQRLPGAVFSTDTYPLCIAATNGALAITHLQIEGKKETTADAFVNGYPAIYSARLHEIC